MSNKKVLCQYTIEAFKERLGKAMLFPMGGKKKEEASCIKTSVQR